MSPADTRQTAAVRPPDDRRVLGRYLLERRLGSGGFGVVWLARDEHLERPVAVKRIPVGDPAVAARAEREARAAARLAHPGIVALYEAGRDDEAVYLVSELVRGETLGALMHEGALSDRDVVRAGVALCAALAHAHGRGVVHRDVKPGNVLLPDAPEDGSSVAKLTDFGIARLLDEDVLTRTGDVVGTLAYMAPEQAEGRGAGKEADLYSLALVLYEGLSGTNPVRGRTPADTARRVGEPLPALGRLRRDLPVELADAIDRAVEPVPRERGSLADLKRALTAAVDAVDDEPGTVEGGLLEPVTKVAGLAVRPREPRIPRRERRDGGHPAPAEWGDPDAAPEPPPRGARGALRRLPLPHRLTAAVGVAGLAAVALVEHGPVPGVEPVTIVAGAGVAALVLPRLTWLAVVLTTVAWLLSEDLARHAGVVAAAAAPVPVLLARARPGWWSAPLLAPLLGAATLAGAFPAVAGQARTWLQRGAVGALGGWWLVLSGTEELPLLREEELPVVAVWAVASVVLPWVVRGRVPALDLIAAGGWAAGLAVGTEAALGSAPDGLVPGAVVAGILAVAVRAFRGPVPPAIR